MTQTIHAQLAEIVREVVKADESAIAEMLRMGITPEARTVELTTRLRTALTAYDQAAAAASETPVRAAIIKAHAELEAGNSNGVSSALATAMLLLDYDAKGGPFAPDVEKVN